MHADPAPGAVAEIIANLDEAEGFGSRATPPSSSAATCSERRATWISVADRALKEAEHTVRYVQQNPGFARLVVEDEGQRTEVDLGADARLFPAESRQSAPLLSGEELAIDKLLALFGRAEARDFVDLLAIEHLYGLERLCALAAEKDRGFDAAVLANMLGRFGRLRRQEFDFDDATYEQLGREVESWRERALELAQHRSPARDPGRDRGPEPGLDL